MEISAAEASTRLRAIQQDLWRLLQDKKYHEAAKLSEKLLEAASQLRRAAYNELDKYMEAHASSQAANVASNDPLVPPKEGD